MGPDHTQGCTHVQPVVMLEEGESILSVTSEGEGKDEGPDVSPPPCLCRASTVSVKKEARTWTHSSMLNRGRALLLPTDRPPSEEGGWLGPGGAQL